MTRYYILIIAYLLIFSNLNAQVLEKKWVEKIIVDNQNQKNVNQLKQYFDTLQTHNNAQNVSKEIIYKIFIANLHAAQKENSNPISSKLYVDAIKLLVENKQIAIIKPWVYTMTGFYYYSYSAYEAALPFFMNAESALKELQKQYASLPMLSDVFMKNAFFSNMLGFHNKSIEYLEEALKYLPKSSNNYGIIFFALGNNYYQLGNKEQALVYYNKTKETALILKNEVRYAKALGEIARLHFDNKNYTKAIQLLKEDIHLSKKNNNERNTMYAQLLLGKVYAQQGNLQVAQKTLDSAFQYAASKPYLKGYCAETIKELLPVVIAFGDRNKELEYRRILDSIGLQIAKMDGEEAIMRTKLQLQKENLNHRIAMDKIKLDKANHFKMGLTFIIMLLVISFLFIWIANKRSITIKNIEYDNRIAALEISKLKSEKELTAKENTLEAHLHYLNLKNQQIKSLENELKLISHSNSSNNKLKTLKLQELLKDHLMTEESWQNFKMAYINERSEEFNQTIELFPGISDASLRVVLLQKLGLNNTETAQLLGVTTDAIKKSKQRLKKKYNETNADI